MKINKCDMYKFTQYDWNFLSIYFVPEDQRPWNITNFLKEKSSYQKAIMYKNYMETENKNDLIQATLLQCTVVLNEERTLVYFCNWGYYDYSRMENKSAQEMIRLCLEDDVEYDVMKYENFVELIDVWIAILEKKPAFVLLYQDEHDWYSLKAFAQEDAMREFVAEHGR
ncbi:MAG: hypothetical protein ACXWL5_04985 [Candidatus Chromulinivorax sp.]